MLLIVGLLLLYRRSQRNALQLPEDPDAHETQNKAFENPQYGTAAASMASGSRRRIPSISELRQYNAAAAAAQQSSPSSAAIYNSSRAGAQAQEQNNNYDAGVRTNTKQPSTIVYSVYSGSSGNSADGMEYSEVAEIERGGSGSGGGAGSASTLLYAVPMEEGGEGGGSAVSNMTLPRSRRGTVVAAVTSGNYEIVSATDGIYAPANEQRYAVAARGGGGTAEYAEVGNQYASKPMMQHGQNVYNTLAARSGAGHMGGAGTGAGGYAQARVNGGAASVADYATANPEYSGGAAGDANNYATANPEYRVLGGEHGGTGQERGNAGITIVSVYGDANSDSDDNTDV